MPDPPQAERNAGLTLQPGLQLGQRQIGLRCDPIHHLTLRLGPGPQLTPRPVWHTLGLPCAVPLCRNLLRPAHAYQKAIRKFRQRFLASIVGQQKFSAQIIPIWLRHRFTRRRVSPIGVYIIKENALGVATSGHVPGAKARIFAVHVMPGLKSGPISEARTAALSDARTAASQKRKRQRLRSKSGSGTDSPDAA